MRVSSFFFILSTTLVAAKLKINGLRTVFKKGTLRASWAGSCDSQDSDEESNFFPVNKLPRDKKIMLLEGDVVTLTEAGGVGLVPEILYPTFTIGKYFAGGNSGALYNINTEGTQYLVKVTIFDKKTFGGVRTALANALQEFRREANLKNDMEKKAKIPAPAAWWAKASIRRGTETRTDCPIMIKIKINEDCLIDSPPENTLLREIAMTEATTITRKWLKHTITTKIPEYFWDITLMHDDNYAFGSEKPGEQPHTMVIDSDLHRGDEVYFTRANLFSDMVAFGAEPSLGFKAGMCAPFLKGGERAVTALKDPTKIKHCVWELDLGIKTNGLKLQWLRGQTVRVLTRGHFTFNFKLEKVISFGRTVLRSYVMTQTSPTTATLVYSNEANEVKGVSLLDTTQCHFASARKDGKTRTTVTIAKLKNNHDPTGDIRAKATAPWGRNRKPLTLDTTSDTGCIVEGLFRYICSLPGKNLS